MPALRHPTLLVEYETTRDLRRDDEDGGWTCLPVPPPGRGWVIADDRHERRTRWRRIRLVEAETVDSGRRPG